MLVPTVLDHCAFFSSMVYGLNRRRSKVHGQMGPSARPFSSSLLTVTSPWYALAGESLPGTIEAVICQLNTSPLTSPSTVPDRRPSGPLHLASHFRSILQEYEPYRPFTACGANCPMKRNGPSHVPVTSTRVMVAVVQSPRAHPRLKSVSTIMNAPVHLLLVSPAHGHGSKRRRGDHISESERDREHAIA